MKHAFLRGLYNSNQRRNRNALALINSKRDSLIRINHRCPNRSRFRKKDNGKSIDYEYRLWFNDIIAKFKRRITVKLIIFLNLCHMTCSSRYRGISKVIFRKVTSYGHLFNTDASREHEVRVVAFSLIDDARSKLRSSEAWPSLSRRHKHTPRHSLGILSRSF